MGYSKNRSNQPPVGDRKATVGAASRRFSRQARLILAVVLIVVLGAAGVWRWMVTHGEEQERNPKTDVTKRAPRKNPSSTRPTPKREANNPPEANDSPVVQPKGPLTNWDIRHLSKDETNGLNQAEQNYWKMYHPDPPPDQNQPEHNKGKYRIFKNRTDNDIAFLMATEPGTPVYGGGEFFARGFTRKFLKSLETPIVINDDDSEYDRSVKQAVIDARKELKERYDRGEDIEKVMRDTRAEIQRLGQYKIQVEKLVKKETSGAARKGLTDEDIGDVIRAANKMLEEKGVAPIEPSPLLRRALKLQSTIGD